MASEPPSVPLPPPPLQDDGAIGPDRRVHCAASPLAFLSGFLLALGWRLVHAQVYGFPLAHVTASFYRTAIADSAWGAGLLALGACVADRMAPATWRRPLRWALGMGISYLVPGPKVLMQVLRSPGSFGAGLAWTCFGATLVAAIGLVMGRAARHRRPWPTLILTGAACYAVRMLTAGSLVFWYTWQRMVSVFGMGPGCGDYLMELAESTSSGALLGLVLAIGLSVGQPPACAEPRDPE